MPAPEHDDASATPFAPLAAVLANVSRPGDFCAHGTVVTPIPRIDVGGVGTIAFPLPPFQAEQLLAAAEAAPYGRGADTLVDPDVRRAWQISPGRVRLDDRQWDKTLASIVASAAAGLGVDGDVTAELYKMLVYDAGGFFVPHRDTEKAPSMFGTLVIVLPSTYRGGDLVVRHGGREAVLTLPGEDVARVSWGAFYADCVHELRPITNGYRLCLVYNLLRIGTSRPVAPDHSREVEGVAAFLEEWARSTDASEQLEDDEEGYDEPPVYPNKLVHLLEHHYTPAELSFDTLKNRDAALASVLLAAAELGDAVVHLAMVSIEESGSAEPLYDERRHGHWGRYEDEDEDQDFEIHEIFERVETVSGWVRADEQEVTLGALPIDEDELFPPDALDDEEPDEKHLHEATGNGGASFERTYRRAALVVWPRSLELAVVAQAPLASLVGMLLPLVTSTDPGERLRGQALATRIIEGPPSGSGTGRVDLLSVLLRLGDPALVARYVRAHLQHGFAPTEIDTLLACHGLLGGAVLAALVASIFETNAPARAPVCLDLLDRLVTIDPSAARTAAPVLLARLPGDPTAEGNIPEHLRARPDAGWLTRLLDVLLRLSDPPLLDRAVAYTRDCLAPQHLDAIVLPAVLDLWRDGAATNAAAALAPLHTLCVTHLRRRVAEPCEAPTDWTREAHGTCRCADCVTFRAFLVSPREQRWELKAVQGRRTHVESQLSGADVDIRTERKGSPHTLVCVKNRRSYERRFAQREADRAALVTLGVG
ncbi:MAG: 2OG-Fe(II) oxygenase [Myxococcota bacterium]